MTDLRIETVEMHTGGEPVRLVVGGFPDVPGSTILAKRRHAREHLDHLRRLLIFEPRGHYDMYGVIPVEPDHPEAHLAVLFIHNEGYSTMCGHAVIALGRWAAWCRRLSRRPWSTSNARAASSARPWR
jgi:proline racemase